MSNGRLDTRLLAARSGVLLAPATAAAWDRMAAACRTATGVSLDIVNRWGGYRDWADQDYLDRHPPAGINVAAAGSSTHGYGTALDITFPTLDAAGGWVQANCRRFGFAVPPRGDRNHFQYTGNSTTVTSTPTNGTVAAAPRREDNDEMYVNHEDSRWAAAIYCIYTDPRDGRPRMRACGRNEAAGAISLAIPYNDATLTALGIECRLTESIPALIGTNITAATFAAALAPLLNADDDDDDETRILAAITAATACINANIDDQPTHFNISPA